MSTSVLTRVLSRHGLTNPDGRPLFAYRLDDDELADLLAEVRSTPPDAPTIGAAFCLLSAELWRRHYDGGSWRWAIVLDRLAPSSAWSSLSPTALPVLISRGLAWWRRPLLHLVRREFLGSIALEAGLPLPVLHHPDARIRTFLKLLLTDLRVFGTHHAEELAERLSDHLPERLRNRTFLTLAVALTAEALALAAALGAAPASPSALDAARPGWRHALPLRIDDDAAMALVTGLVDDARAAPPSRPLRAIVQLEGDHLRRSLRWPAVLPRTTLAEWLGLPAESLPVRADVLSESPRGLYVVALLAARVSGGDYRVEPLAGPPLPSEPTTDIVLVLRAQGRILGRIIPPGGTALSDLPWIFRPDRHTPGALVLVAQGSTRFASDIVVLAPPAFRPMPASPPVAHLLGRLRYDLHSDTELSDGVSRIALRIGEPAEDLYELAGPRLPGHPDVFLGWPRLWRTTTSGDRLAVARDRLVVRAEDAWVPVAPDQLGAIQAALRDDDGIVWADRIRVVPSDTHVTIEPVAGGGARVAITSSPAPRLGVAPSYPGSVDLAAGAPSYASVHLGPANEVPLHVDLVLDWGHGRLDLRLPFPRRGRRFVRAGAPLPRDARIGLDDLHTVACEAWSHPPIGTRVFALDAALRARGATTEPVTLTRLEPGPHGRHTLPLYAVARQLERLLAASTTPDAEVRLTLLDAAGSPSGAPQLIVARFSSTIAVAPDRSHVTGPADATFEAIRFVAPETVVPLPATAPGRALTDVLTEPGAWMVFARRDAAVIAAPKLVNVSGALPQSRLRDAMGLPTFEARKGAIGAALEALADDPTAPDWELVRELLSRVDRFGAATFEVVRHLPLHPRALVRALLRAPDRARFVRAIESLPFHWSTLPVAAVRHAVEHELATADATARLLRDVSDAPSRDVLATALLVPARDALAAHHPGTAVIFAAAAQGLASLACPELGLARHTPGPLLDALTGAMLDLRRRHPDDDWPRLPMIASLRRDLPLPATWRALVASQTTSDEIGAIIVAPLVAALASATPDARLPSPVEAFGLRLAESFDPDYFAAATRPALALALAQGAAS